MLLSSFRVDSFLIPSKYLTNPLYVLCWSSLQCFGGRGRREGQEAAASEFPCITVHEEAAAALHLAAVKPKQKHRLIYPPTCPALELGRVTGEYRCVRMCVREVSEV